MRVTSLRLANVRSIKAAEFRFQPGFNLVVGVNGAGKTSTLDALCVCLAAYLKRSSGVRVWASPFTLDDIRDGANALDAECGARIGSSEHRYLIHKPREDSAPRPRKAGMPRNAAHNTPKRESFLGTAPARVTGWEPRGRPLAVLFSTNRAATSRRAPSKLAAAGGTGAALADVFRKRELRLGEIAHWLTVQQTLRPERELAGRALEALDQAVVRFLPEYSNLRASRTARSKLLIDRGQSTLDVAQMSDGERGTLALVLDLARRLVQANPEMVDPLVEAEAVVLIDELELHLHPLWQRRIVRKLESTFPRCQFIATTHSPQVIGEVAHDRIQIMADGGVYSPPHAFGVDSSRVLEEIMHAPPRNRGVEKLLTEVSREIGRQRYEAARELLAQLVDRLGQDDPEVTRIETLIDFMEGED